MSNNFDKSDFLVFDKKEEKVVDTNLPDHILSYDHNTLNGYVRSTNDREEDQFATRLRNICRG